MNQHGTPHHLSHQSSSFVHNMQEAWQGAWRAPSHFYNWTDWEMKEVLVYNGVELRGEHRLLHEDLIAICDAVFEGRQVPRKPKTPTMEELVRMSILVSRIQRAWVKRHAAAKRFQNFISMASDRYLFEQGLMPTDLAEMAAGANGPGATNSFGVGGIPTTSSRRLSYTTATEDKQWVMPDVEIAHIYSMYNHPRRGGPGGELYDWKTTTTGRHCVIGGCGEQLDLWNEGQASELGQFGPGVTNYFKFIKWCFWIMAILTACFLPMAVLNTFGPGQLLSSKLPQLSYTTLGNLRSNSSYVEVTGCGLLANWCKIEKSELATAYGLIDFFASLFLLVAFLWLRSFEKKETEHLNRNTVSASDFTVRVTHLPATTKESELKAHFAHITRHAVHCVHIGFNNGELITAYMDRGKLLKTRYRVVAQIRYWRAQKQALNEEKKHSWIGARKLESLKRQRKQITDRIESLDRTIKKVSHLKKIPVCAFVTFEEEQGMVEALKIYGGSWARWFFMSPEEKFKGYRLVCEQAPEPSTILWENLQYTKFQRVKRQLFVFNIALCAVAFSIVIAFTARYYQNQSSVESGTEACPTDFSQLNKTSQLQLVDENSGITYCYCSPLSYTEQFYDDTCKSYMFTGVKADSVTLAAGLSVAAINQILTLIIKVMGTFERHHSLDSMEASAFKRIFLLNFINTGILTLLLNSRGLASIVGVNQTNSTEEFTTDWYNSAGVTLMIAMMANIFGPHLSHLYHFFNAVKSRKVVVEKLGDSGSLVFTQEHLNEKMLGPAFFMSERYAQSLVVVVVCLMYLAGIPFMAPIGFVSFLVRYWVDKYMFLNFYRTPPRFSERLGRVASHYVYWAIVMHCAFAVWMLGNKTLFTSTNDSNVSYNPYSVTDKFKLKYVLPLVVLLFGLIAYSFVNHFFHGLTHITRALINLSTCGGGSKTDKLEHKHMHACTHIRFITCFLIKTCPTTRRLLSVLNRVSVKYSSALDRGLIKGLATYNVLQNPKCVSLSLAATNVSHKCL